jgi:hypothetical protein
MEHTFMDRYRRAVAGDRPDPDLVLLGNFDVEEQWATGEQGLPRVSFSPGGAVVSRMDEFALLLAGKRDHVVLKTPVDQDYLAYLEDLGVDLPSILVVSGPDPGRTVSQDVLADPRLLTGLGRLAARGALLAPHGVSAIEERLSEMSGMPLAAPPAAVCKAVNSKVYSRRLADRLGLRQPEGRACDTIEELDDAIGWARPLLEAGRRVVVKDAYGVSGKGLAVVTEAGSLDRLRRMIGTRARRAAGERIGLVVEDWVAKRADLTYQFTVGRDGGVWFDFVKEAIIVDGVPTGHRFPTRLPKGQVAELEAAAAAIGALLAEAGYFGVVGVDALLDQEGGLYPLIEINARVNLSTYQATVTERFATPGRSVLAKHYPLRLARPVSFRHLRRRLDGLLFDRKGAGLLVNNFATVNAGADAAQPSGGRLYGLIIAESADRLDDIDRQIAARLHRPLEENPS